MVLFCHTLFASVENTKFEQITIQEGLSQSSVRSIIQDKKGFMWFGTVDGLNKYDGYSLKIFRPDPTNTNSISSPFLRDVIEDGRGFIWVATNGNGLNRYNPRTGRFKRFNHDPADDASLSHDYVWALYESSRGDIWVGTDGGGLNRYDPQSEGFIHYRTNVQDPDSLGDDRILAICEDKQGFIWCGTRGGGLSKLDPQTGRFRRFRWQSDNPNCLSHDHVWCLMLDKEGYLWIGTHGGGLNRMDTKNETFFHYRHQPGQSNSLCHDQVNTLYQDTTGLIWIGTNGGGLNKFDPRIGVFSRYRHDPNRPHSISDDHIFSICEDRSGVLWFGTSVGGVNKLVRNRDRFHLFQRDAKEKNSLSDNLVWSIMEDSQGILWVGTQVGGLNRFDRKKGQIKTFLHDPQNTNSLSGNWIRVIYQAPSQPDILWIGTDNGGLNRLDLKSGQFARYQVEAGNSASISSNRIYSILEDASGNLWIGTRTGGLNRLDRKTGRFTHFRHDPQNPQSLSDDFVYKIYQDRGGDLWIGTFSGGLNRFVPDREEFIRYQYDPRHAGSLSSNSVLSIYEDEAEVLWIGTGGGGLNMFNRRDEEFEYFGLAEGFPNQVVYGILGDYREEENYIWVSTNSGVSRFEPRTHEVKNYSQKDGLQSNEFNGGAYFQNTKTGEMFFGGINGFNAFFPEKIKDNTYVPPILITSFRKLNKEFYFDRPVSEVKEIRLSHRDVTFSFEFAALDFTSPEKNRYVYKMEGLDKEFIITDANNRQAHYSTVAPGEYTFRVLGSNNDGVWNEKGIAIKIFISPPYWQTWWFRILAALIIALTSWLIYKIRVKSLFQRTRMETELQTAHTAQMSIMPQQDPKVAGYDISGICIPANEVGGDFFDYFWMNQEKRDFGISIGDVSGKGMKAAMAAVMAHGIIFSEAARTNQVEKIIDPLNKSLYYKTDKQIFTTLCIAALDVERRRITFANAGLPKPILKRGGTTRFLESAGSKIPLGIGVKSHCRSELLQLESGDLLIFYSDGISEACNADLNFYGSERLLALVERMTLQDQEARAIRQLILQDIEGFAGRVDQHDDMTLVVVKVL
jgi:serine phosphatase RsbU (regulator of sigma subunit)/ligand-binding sensor domain-containing protein